MKHYTDPIDPTKRIPYYEREEIERITWDELRITGQASDEPEPVCIETFCMRRWGIGLDYHEFPPGVFGEIVFSTRGVAAIRIRREFGEGGHAGLRHIAHSTAAHEAGHGIFHASEIVPEIARAAPGIEEKLFRQRCFADTVGPECEHFARGSFTRHRALEWQANAAMGSLLIPRPAVFRALETKSREGVPSSIRRDGFDVWVALLAEQFDVSRELALYRLLDIFPTLREIAAPDLAEEMAA